MIFINYYIIIGLQSKLINVSELLSLEMIIQRGVKMLKLDRRKLDLILAEKCYSLVDLTKKAGVSSALITKVVSGNYTLTTKTLGKIAKALEVKPQDLIQE